MFASLLGTLRGPFDQLRQGPAGQWYLGLSPRDRLALHVLGGFLGLLLVWALIWIPVREYADRSQQRFEGESRSLAWMQANAARIDPAAGEDEQVGAGSILSIASAAARRLEITLNRFQPEGERGISVTLDDVPFNASMQWIDVLEREHSIHVAQITIERAEASGTADIRLLLRGD